MTLLDKQIIEYLTGMLLFHDGFTDWETLTYWQDSGYLDAWGKTLNPSNNMYREPF